MIYNPCVVCARPVFPLAGQSVIIDSLFLEKGDNVPVGPCHTVCLQSAAWASILSQRRIAHYKNDRGFIEAASNPLGIVLCGPNAGGFAIITSAGMIYTPTKQQAEELALEDDRAFYWIQHEMTAHLYAFGPDIEAVKTELTKTKRYPLWNVVDRLGIADLVVYPEGVKAGELLWVKGLVRYWDEDAITVKTRYQVSTERSLGELLVANRNFEWTMEAWNAQKRSRDA